MRKQLPFWLMGVILGLMPVASGALWISAGSAGRGALSVVAPAACTQLIVNGGFESGSTGWTASTNGPYALIGTALPHTGQKSAILGARDNAQDELAQTIAIPSDNTATLQFWWYMLTEETDHWWDKLDVLVTPTGGSAIRLRRITDGDVAGNWQQVILDLSAYAGQTVRLSFRAITDANRPTDFYVDDVGLEACSGTVDPTATPTATATRVIAHLPIVLR